MYSLVIGILPTVVEEILPTAFIGEKEEGKTLPADKFVASCRQLFVLGSWTPYSHRSISIQRYHLIFERDRC